MRKVGYVEDYLAVSRGVGAHVPASFVGAVQLEADKTYRAFRNGTFMPLPPELTGIPRDRVVDVQEDRMWLHEQDGGESAAEVVFDARAVNHAAVCLDPGVVCWGVQIRDLAAKGIKGRWHAYAVVRVEALAKTGLAFTAGVYDRSSNRHLLGIRQLLKRGARGAPARNVATQPTTGLNKPIADGRYRLYDFGVHDFNDAINVWIGTTGGVDPKNVKAIYVDRFIFVRED